MPLSPGKKIKLGIVGDANNVKGGGSGSVWSTHIVSPTEGITARLQNGPHELFSANQAGTPAATYEEAGAASCCPKSGSCPAGFNENASIQGFDVGPPPYPGHPTASAAECCQYCTKTPGCAYCTCLACFVALVVVSHTCVLALVVCSTVLPISFLPRVWVHG